MAKWDGDIMATQKRAMDECIDRMKTADEEIMSAVGIYSRAMNDQVQEGATAMVQKIDAVLREMQEVITQKLNKVGDSAKRISAIQSQAKSKIDSLK
jgi:uncharacterized protein Yka (UPF0111/DUF47 family)